MVLWQGPKPSFPRGVVEVSMYFLFFALLLVSHLRQSNVIFSLSGKHEFCAMDVFGCVLHHKP
jgi:hypothetical protein